jgi:tRNA(adenine34) deaminase
MHPLINADEERDAIFSLLACALVAETWDDSPLGEGLGHNIGAVLVDKKHRPVAWARNETSSRRDLTEHAELRLMRGYIAADPERTELHKHQIFTTLEPCVMCAGMMAMTNVRRVVYAQRDPLYGGVFDRLYADPTPYTKQVEALPAPELVRSALEQQFAASGHAELINWLPSPEAHSAYRAATNQLNSFAITHPENTPHLETARTFLNEEAI